MIEHYHRSIKGYWYKCSCIGPFDKENIISYGIVPMASKRIPANNVVISGDVEWSL